VSWPEGHLTPALVDELRQRLDRYAIDAKMLMGNREAAIAFAGAVNAYQRQALQVSPLVVSLLTLPAEVQLLRDALAHP
jgi:hypothetical protein